MVKFLEPNTEFELRKFIQHTLAYKYNQQIQVRDDYTVTGTTGQDEITECLKVSFFPANSQVEWIEDKISADIHRYCFEHEVYLVKSPVIERDVWNGEIRYSIIYIDWKWRILK